MGKIEMTDEYVRVGTTLYKIVFQPLINGTFAKRRVPWSMGTLRYDHGKDFIASVDAEAICYFNHHIEMRRNAMQVYADKFGPLTIDTANPDAYWDWAKQPLPWEGGGC